MMKALKLFPLLAAAVLAGCSSDDTIATDGGTAQGGNDAATLIVEASGVETVSVVAPKGTDSLTVEYLSGGAAKSFSVPFTTVSGDEKSSFVKGYIKLYSPTETAVTIKNGSNVIAENVILKGFVTSPSLKGSTQTAGDRDAYYVVYLSDELESLDPAGECKTGVRLNGGRVNTNADIDWEYIYSKANDKVISSPDGSGLAEALAVIPDFFAAKNSIFPASVANVINSNDYEIVWTFIQVPSNGRDVRVAGHLQKKQTESTDKGDTGKIDKGDTDESGTKDPSVVPSPSTPDQPTTDQKTLEGIYHYNGTMMWDCSGDEDFNDLVLDYDVEYRSTNSGLFPYIKIVAHVRAMSADAKNFDNLDRVNIGFKNLNQFMGENKALDITFHTVSYTDKAKMDENGIPFYRYGTPGCGLVPVWQENYDYNCASITGLQWILTNGTQGWYDLDSEGNYNLTQESLNGKPFATLSIELHPDEGDYTKFGADVRTQILDILTDMAVCPDFSFSKAGGQSCSSLYRIAPSMTPHVKAGSTFKKAFPNYPADGWYDTFNANEVVNVK